MTDTCRYCTNPAEPADPDDGRPFRFMGGVCAVCLDVEFCCNVSKDTYGTKSCAALVAVQHGLGEAHARLTASTG